MVTAALKLKDAFSLEEKLTNIGSILKSRDITLQTNVCIVKAMVFSVVIYRCESWTIKKAEHWRIDTFELWCCRRLLKSLGQQGDQPVSPKGSQSWIFIGKTNAEVEKNPLATWCKDLTHLKKTLMLGRLRAGEEGGDREWNSWMDHRLNGHEFEQTLGEREGKGSLLHCSPWGYKESDMTEWLNNSNNLIKDSDKRLEIK